MFYTPSLENLPCRTSARTSVSRLDSYSNPAPENKSAPTVSRFCLSLVFNPSPSFSPEILRLQLKAVPDYPVAAGQRVNLHCKSFNTTSSVTWSWQRLQNESWTAVASGQDLTLTKPEQSGRYRCLARWGLSQQRESTQHAVVIVSMPARGQYCSVLKSLSHVNKHLGRSEQHLHCPEGKRTAIESDGWVDVWT